ncbi:PLP-dependent aminotransferase family protein [Neisseriaceae bacterium TC5R-5]|nr:PLP-dependent aminotransferase family protein [Neisseriaceae bacterium TC5R-5]
MRQASEIELALRPRAEKCSRTEWLYAEIRLAILAGRLKPGARLPSSRDLARQYALSRGTVVAVYEQLIAEDYLCATTGQGSFVSQTLPDALMPASAKRRSDKPGCLSEQAQQMLAAPSMLPLPASAMLFAPHRPDYSVFPLKIWNGIVSKRANALRLSGMAYVDPAGYLPLRAAIATHLQRSQRIACCAEDVVIVNSTQQSIDLCARLLLNPGDEVWMEEPGYPGAYHLLAMTGARMQAIPVDSNGLNTDIGLRQAPDARLAYVTAAHQLPLGGTMSLERRLALLRWAERKRATILEDDYDGEYRYDGAPLAALKSLDEQGRVVYMGTFSKLLFPSMRLGFMVLPAWLRQPVTAALSLTCRHLNLHMQLALTEFIEQGHFARHLRRTRLIYHERAEAFTAACQAKLQGLLTVVPITTGLDATTLLREQVDETKLEQRLRQAGIGAKPLSFYSMQPVAPSGLLMGFASANPDGMVAGVEQLARVLESAER